MMSAVSADLPGLTGAKRRAFSGEVEFHLRSDYADERLSPRELEALCPVLPELIAELLSMSVEDR